jgi:hypothetical protein
MSDTPAAARWRKLLAECEATGLSANDFAKRRGLKPATLKWWRSRLKKLDAERAPFTELVVTPAATPVVCVATTEPTVVVALEDLRAHIVVDQDTDLPLLKRVLGALC